MKSKKFISGLLAGAMVLTSVATFGVSEAEAAGEDGLVAYYTFEDSLANTVGEADDTATPMKARVNESSEMTEDGTAVYEAEGFKGSAIRLNDYGLRLNKKDLGDNFTVSMWLKSDGTFPENQVLMFLGNHNPEKWIAVCGGEPWGGNSSLVKFWGRDVEDATSNPTPTYSSHTTLGTMNIAEDEWHKLTVTGSDSTVTAYLDGEAVAYASGQDGKTNHPLVGDSQDIYIGVNNWDTEFTGLVDEVKVYNTTASAEEVQKDYLRDIGEPEGFKVASYSFEDGLVNDEGTETDTASAIVTGLNSYNGEVDYDENGFKGSAIRLGDYGLKLNKENLGENFSVSMWLNSDSTFPENQVLMFLGHHDPEKWIAVSGGEPWGGKSSLVKFWGKDGSVYTSHTTLSTTNISAGSWHQLTVTGSEDTLTAYLDGEAIAYASGQSGASNHPLAGENQDIYIGVNYWNTEFEGLVDEIEVYDCTLSADYIKEAYDAAYSNPEDFKTGSWSFENGLANDEGGDDASAIITALGAYDGNITYDENGFDGKAIRLGDYGLDLNQDNLGENFSVSMWVKPDGTYLENQVLALLGYHADPQNWIAVSGNRTGSSECKFWANGGNYNTWTTLGTPSVNADGWHQLVITGSEDTVTAYLDGQSVGSGASNHPLNRADGNGKIYIGVNYWNDEFSGLVDEIEVYRYTLSAEDIAAAYAEATADPKEGKIAEYTFEESIEDNDGAAASAVVTGLGSYSGEVKYEAGFRGDAVRLGDYGLQLNKTNMGENFTVSMWVKPDGTYLENQVLTMLGYHEDPEKWIAVSGNKSGTSQCKFWANGGNYSTWTTLGTPTINADGWHQLVITGTESTVTAYLDGVQVGSGISNHPLNRAEGDIYLGVNNWDNEFSGLMDDVEIYGRALTAGEISEIYVTDLLSADEAALTVPAEVKWDMTLPAAGNSGQTMITWTSDNAAIDADTGKVTRPENGDVQVKLTATITSGSSKVEKEFNVTVLAKDPDSDIVDYADWLSLNAGFVSADFSLPQTVGEATVAWSSNDPAIAIDGTDAKVARPDGKNKAVTLTATVSLEGTDKTVTKEFPLTVLADGPDLLTYISNAPATGQNGGMKIAGESDGSYSVLHSNQPILYASKGTKSLSSAQIFRAADGSFGVVAADGGNNGNLILFDSKDLITYSNERMLSVPGVSAIKEVNCVYDSADKVYRIFIQDGNDKVWMAESADLTAIDSVAAGDYSFPSVTGAPSDAVNPWTAALTQAEYDAVVKKFASIQNTGVTAPEDVEVTEGEDVELPETVTAQYSDGSTKQLGVVWDEEDLANVGSNGAGEYTVEGTVQRTISYTDPENPLVYERADPYIVYDSERERYYFTGSYPTNGVGGTDGYDRLVIRAASTIDGLSDADAESVIWDESWDDGSGNAYSQWIWAPEIHKIGDYWYIISTAGTNGGNNFSTLRPFMMKCTDPENITDPDSWEDPVRVKPMAGDEANCLNAMSLDMTYFEAGGKSYLAWADFTQTGISSIYIATIDPSNPTQLTSPCTIISRPEYSWEYVRATVNEGPAVFKSNGKVYMAFSASGTGSEYCVGLLTADEGADLLDADSWVKSNYPVLTSTDFNDEVSGPGHNSFTVDEYGNVIIVYHARPAKIHSSGGIHNGDPLQDPCRYAYLQPVNIAADGSPVLNMTPEQELADEYAKVTVKVNVKADALTGIEITKDPAKLSYKVGDTFDPAGIEVTATFQSGATKTLGADAAGLTFSPEQFTEAGDQTVVVSYTVGQITFTDSIDVTVSEQTTEPEEPEVVADSAVVKTQPTKTEYKAGEKFDAAGLVVTVALDNGTTADYTLAELADLVITPETLAEDTEAVTLSFTVDGAKQSVTVAVDVKPADDTDTDDGNGGGTTPPAGGTDNDDLKDEPKDDQGGGAVQTGDTTNILLTAAVMIFALAGAAAVVILKRRKRG